MPSRRQTQPYFHKQDETQWCPRACALLNAERPERLRRRVYWPCKRGEWIGGAGGLRASGVWSGKHNVWEAISPTLRGSPNFDTLKRRQWYGETVRPKLGGFKDRSGHPVVNLKVRLTPSKGAVESLRHWNFRPCVSEAGHLTPSPGTCPCDAFPDPKRTNAEISHLPLKWPKFQQ